MEQLKSLADKISVNYSALKASGVATFTGSEGATIASGSEIKTSGDVSFITKDNAIIDENETTVDVEIEASNTGVAGNVEANTITTIVDTIEDVTAVTNAEATTGGADAIETTSELTTAILAATPTRTQLNSCTVENLKVLADCLEMTYVYTNKADLIELILKEYESEE